MCVSVLVLVFVLYYMLLRHRETRRESTAMEKWGHTNFKQRQHNTRPCDAHDARTHTHLSTEVCVVPGGYENENPHLRPSTRERHDAAPHAVRPSRLLLMRTRRVVICA